MPPIFLFIPKMSRRIKMWEIGILTPNLNTNLHSTHSFLTSFSFLFYPRYYRCLSQVYDIASVTRQSSYHVCCHRIQIVGPLVSTISSINKIYRTLFSLSTSFNFFFFSIFFLTKARVELWEDTTILCAINLESLH